MNVAWRTLQEDERDNIWDLFYERFMFNPSVCAEDFPSILEPSPSVTYKISRKFGEDDKIADLQSKVLEGLRSQVSREERIYILDWQHVCYWFYPHRDFLHEWFVPVLPNGDYYIFIAEDLRFGIFGHPWEWTSCIWGEELMRFFNDSKPNLWGEVVRQKP